MPTNHGFLLSSCHHQNPGCASPGCARPRHSTLGQIKRHCQALPGQKCISSSSHNTNILQLTFISYESYIHSKVFYFLHFHYKYIMIVVSGFHTFPILSSSGFRHQSIESLASLRHDTIFKFGPQPSLGSRWIRRSHPYDSAPEPG